MSSDRPKSRKARHRVSVETQIWKNIPPYSPKPMHRGFCKCGWRSEWFVYPENVPRTCALADEVKR